MFINKRFRFLWAEIRFSTFSQQSFITFFLKKVMTHRLLPSVSTPKLSKQ